jgi:hypothetical protein
VHPVPRRDAWHWAALRTTFNQTVGDRIDHNLSQIHGVDDLAVEPDALHDLTERIVEGQRYTPSPCHATGRLMETTPSDNLERSCPITCRVGWRR